MKRIFPISILLVALIFAFVWYHKSINNNPKLEPITETSNQVEQTILLYPESGDVSFKATPNEEWKSVTVSPTVIPNQAIVKTEIGKASVLLPDNSTISLDNNTEITVNYSKESISIYQTIGTTYHRVEALLSGSTYQVQTAGTLAAVRGTKFVVKYDAKTKKTKVAVTENKVQVSTITKPIGTSTPVEESILVEQGKTASVETREGIPREKHKPILVIDTDKDIEMKSIINKNKQLDIKINGIKKESSNKEEYRKEVKRIMFDDKDDGSTKEIEKMNEEKLEKTTDNATPVKETEQATTIRSDDTNTGSVIQKTTTGTITQPAIVAPTIVIKVSEEEFFNAFEPLFIKYFYLDEVDTPCDVKVTPEERVRTVVAYGESKGYPFTSTTLLSFAQEIDKYCIRKDASVKTKLQSRFDNEYPFNQ